MVTQAPQGSGRIRSQIGISKRRVEDCLDEEVQEQSDIEGFNVDDLQQFLEDLHEDLQKLQKRCQTLADLDRKWKNLMDEDLSGEERKIQEQYVVQYGNYLETLERGKIRIQVLKDLYVIGLNRIRLLDENRLILLPTLGELSKEGAQQDEQKVISKNPPGEIQTAEQFMDKRTDDKLGAVQAVAAPPSNQPILVNTFGHITLPQMTLPTFTGNVMAWYEFKESFESIMNSIKVDELTKLHYLKSVVSGEAGELVKYLQTTHKNFEIAMTMLEEQYGGKERIQHVLLQQLREIPDVTSSNTDAATLQLFITKATSIFSQLIGYGVDMDNIATADIIKSKLPKRVIAKIYGVATGELPKSAKELLRRVREISRAESLVAVIYNNKSERSTTTMATMNHQNHHHQHQQRTGFRRGAEQGVQQQSRSKVSKPCAFCVEDRMRHYPRDCRKFSTVELRKQRAKELKLCFRCLQSGHTARQCSYKCYGCNGPHHESICFHREERSTENKQQHSGPVGQQAAFSSSHGPSVPPFHNQQGVKGYSQGSNNQSGGGQYNGQNGGSSGYQGYQRRTKPRSYQQGNGQQQQTYAVDASVESEDAFTHSSQSDPELDDIPINTEAVSQVMEIDAQETVEVIETPRPPVIMMSADVPILDDNGEEHLATVFFDSGSNTSYIRKEFAERLKLKPTSQKKLNVNTFAHRETKRLLTTTFDVCFKTKHSTATVQLCKVDNIASNIVTAEVESDVLKRLLQDQDQYLQLKRTRKEVDILIGLDSYLEIVGQVNTLRLANGLQLHITDVGPIVAGKENVVDSALTFSTLSDADVGDKELSKLLQSFWDLESIGIIDVNPKATIDEETQAFFDTTTTQNMDGRYVVRLPYASKKEISSNRQLAFFRLQGSLKRLKKDDKLLDQYANTFKEQMTLDFIEVVPNENHMDGCVLHYLAHHPVFKQSSKSTKMRIVFDGSAKQNKQDLSLNEHLHVGTNLLPDIAACLLRMRTFVILISADIQKAFLQLELNILDRDATRFLWIDEEGQVICYRFKRVPFGLKSSPYLLNATIRLHLSKQTNPVAKAMARSIYVDNVYIGVQTIHEAERFYHDSKEIFRQAKMNLTQYCSNSDKANEYFAAQEKTEKETGIQKLLGVKWDTTSDEFIYSFPEPKADTITKRKVLKFIATVYDPIGFLSPTTLFGKLFFKLLTEEKMSWDEMLSKKLEDQWAVLLKQWSSSSCCSSCRSSQWLEY
ncbi:Protein CBG25525 [Caenorhabditis briggsae]|uniref:Protein CBG25525 n=1 Tax=Caenorhabditis briggsae TaxID=6238 RepID=B6IFQ0_CAEBR|nr:Protein CBG25525 [Caenorhabditis briggsae]CAR98730.1 Protein CBG25525 [Caenorhabditis briggsae]